MSWTDIKDPNIDLISLSPNYDAAKPTKRWIDRRAVDPANEEEFFLYSKLARDSAGNTVLKKFYLDREEAGAANIPNGDLWQPGMVWNGAEVPIPIRDLGPDESVVIDPFNRIVVTKASAAPITSGDLEAIRDQLNRIESTLDQICPTSRPV